MAGEFCFNEDSFNVTEEIKAAFEELGYILVRNILDKEEVDLITKVVGGDLMQREAWGVPDSNGKPVFLTLWTQPGNDVTGMLARSQKVAGTAEKLIGGEVYHYHSKLLMKDPLVSGGFDWHQDYGYWYNNGILYPDCLTVFVAIDKCAKENGCLQILSGSHKCGRIEHHLSNGQTAADITRVNEIIRRCPLKYVEMEPGDALFFHSNVLHHSSPNSSPDRRWALGIAYNMASNNPTVVHHCSSYVPLEMVPNIAIKECKTPDDFTGKDFMDPAKHKKGQVRYIRRGESLDALKGD